MPGAVRCPHPNTHAAAAAAAAIHAVPPPSGEGRDWEPDLRAPAPNVSPSIMWMRSPCVHPRPRGAAAASSPRSAGLKKPKPPLLPSRLRQRPAGPGGLGLGAERAGAPGTRTPRGVGASFSSPVPNQGRREEEGPGRRPGLTPGSIPDPGVRLGQNGLVLLVGEPGLRQGRLHTVLRSRGRGRGGEAPKSLRREPSCGPRP